MAFMSAIGYRLWIGNAASATASHPTSNSGLTEILNLTNCSLETSTESQSVTDYGTAQGYQKAVATSQSYSIPMSMNLDQVDAGYLLLKAASNNSMTQFVHWYRETPDPGASVTTVEKYAGTGIITSFSEAIEAGSIAVVNFTLLGYGAPTYTAAT